MKKILGLIVLLQAVWIILLMTGHSPFQSKEQDKTPVSAEDVKVDRIPEIKLSEDMARSSGIRVEAVGSAGMSLSDAPWGSVWPVVGLTESRMKLERAELDVAQGSLALQRARTEAARLEAAWKEGGNVARKLVDQARADELEADQKLKASQRVLETTRESVRAEWGGSMLAALEEPEGGFLAPVLHGSAQLLFIAETQTELGQVVLAEDPQKSAMARRVAPAVQVDAGSRKSGSYWIVSSPDFKVGLRVRLLIPKKAQVGLARVPESSVIWQAGSAWVYVEKEPHVYLRTRVTLDEPDRGGWVARSGVNLQDRVVVEGAQLLLSEESKTQIRNENGD